MRTFAEYQAEALRTAGVPWDKEKQLTCGGLGIAGEAGEVADLIKKAIFHEHGIENLRDKIIEEMGDTFWYLSYLSFALDVPLEEVAARNIEKLKKRYPDGFDVERSRNREGGEECSLCGELESDHIEQWAHGPCSVTKKDPQP